MENEKDILSRLYHVEKLTLKEIADLYGMSSTALGRRFDELGIYKRKPGGKFNPAGQTRKLFRMDQRVIYKLPIGEVSKLSLVHTTTITKYRRRDEILHYHPNSGDQVV